MTENKTTTPDVEATKPEIKRGSQLSLNEIKDVIGGTLISDDLLVHEVTDTTFSENMFTRKREFGYSFQGRVMERYWYEPAGVVIGEDFLTFAEFSPQPNKRRDGRIEGVRVTKESFELFSITENQADEYELRAAQLARAANVKRYENKSDTTPFKEISYTPGSSYYRNRGRS